MFFFFEFGFFERELVIVDVFFEVLVGDEYIKC